jgi:hypothetical protein
MWFFTFYKNLMILFIRVIINMFRYFEQGLFVLIIYTKLIEYITYMNYTFWRVIRFLRYWPLNKF